MRIFRVLIFFLLFSCSSKDIPTSINTSIGGDHFRIEGTKLFVKNLEGFKYFPDVNIFKFSDSIFIHCLYSDLNFTESLSKQEFDFLYNRNYDIITHQDFLINNNPGVYYKLLEGNRYWLYFIFGDDQHEIKLVGTYPKDSSEFNESICNFFTSVYFYKEYEVNPIETAKFDVILDNTDFLFVSYSMNTFIFYQNTDPSVRPNGLYFTQTPAVSDTTHLRLGLQNTLDNLRNSGMQINSTKRYYELIDSNIAYVAEVTGEYEGKPFYSKSAMTSNSNIGLLISTAIYNNIAEYKLQIDSIFETIELLE